MCFWRSTGCPARWWPSTRSPACTACCRVTRPLSRRDGDYKPAAVDLVDTPYVLRSDVDVVFEVGLRGD